VTDDLASLDVAPDGTAVLAEVHATLTRYVVFPSPEAADAVTLYAAATHAQSQLEFAARLVIKSPVKRCGKSRLLDVLVQLVRNPLATADISAAALVRSVTKDDPPTVVLDEADAIFGKALKGDEKAEHLRGILNAGFSRGRPYKRWDVASRKVEDCPTFAMAVIAGIGSMPDTIEDRAVIITLRRKAADESVSKYRTRQDEPKVKAVGERLAEWIQPHADKLADAMPDMPPGLNDRAEDVWESLLAVADLAGAGWPERARRAARILAAEAEESADAGLALRLLADLRAVFGDADKLSTEAIIRGLCSIEEAPWGSFHDRKDPHVTPRDLAEMLRPYKIRPKAVRIGESTPRGYERDAFRDAWQRYGTPLTQGERNERNIPNIAGQSVADVNDVAQRSATPQPAEADDVADGSATVQQIDAPDQDSCAVADVADTPPAMCADPACGFPLDAVWLELGDRVHPGCHDPQEAQQ
jgi:Protein of unknown function (DUF3631)